MNWKAFIPLGLFVAFVGIFGIGLTMNPKELKSEFIDKPVPEFELESLLPGEAPVRSSDLKGDFFLLNVFGSWCQACITEHPYLMELQANNTIRIVGLDWRDKRPDALEWLQRWGNPYDEIGFDEHSEVAIGLGVTGAPETFLVDPEGQIRYKHVGPVTRDVWQKEFAPRIDALKAGAIT
ncbi:MAG: DsbE family thiol:disulfide interchange protein [Ponticaulis sp.]|nr:DsbE family thiol:disulfide interchange protein [Ponticaulis sp.]|tara:strand:+ start:22175 stop:22714 length:540 start_codon:yes stop_codon:yes gene_type:complete